MTQAEVTARVETPQVESARIEPVKSETNRSLRNRKALRNCAARPTDRRAGLPIIPRQPCVHSAYVPCCATGTGGGACLRNRMRWYSQPIATSTRPRHMNDSAR